MINKEKYIAHIKEEDMKYLLTQTLDKAEVVLKNHDIKTTDFLNPYELKMITSILSSFPDIAWISAGGYEKAERKMLVIFQDYLTTDVIERPLAALKVVNTSEFTILNHRDYLGALLSLGIKREKIGDIILHNSGCYIILEKTLKDYVLFNLHKIGNNSITIKEISLDDIKPLEIKFKEITGTVASLRLDSIISLAFKTSRTEAQALISREKVYINWSIANKNFHEMNKGDTISVRGKGRVIVEEIQGKTKSGRIHIKLKKPI